MAPKKKTTTKTKEKEGLRKEVRLLLWLALSLFLLFSLYRSSDKIGHFEFEDPENERENLPQRNENIFFRIHRKKPPISPTL